ncbi:MAG: U32 family peptidase, partial [Clostridia bacterium]|nr:U32 family peptidase [Clostridia bacterium]
HNRGGVKLLEELGFSRVIPARELSLAEICDLCASTSLEVEVFVHGALCMCFSGACYLSSILGQRSGNRGLCAQPCRLDFHINGRDHALSLKDMCHIPQIHALREAGVTSLKIEGRMKRPEYVYAAASACRRALNGQKPDLDTLRAVFSRSGFTDGYLTDKRDLTMFGFRQKEDVTAAAPVLKPLAAQMNKECARVKIDLRARIHEQKTELTVSDGAYTARVTGQAPEKALSRALTRGDVVKQLSKTGGTPYKVESMVVELSDGLMLPLAKLNDLRRRALEELTRLRGTLQPHTFAPYDFSFSARPHDGDALWVRVLHANQLDECDETLSVILPPEEISTTLTARFARTAVEIPVFCFPRDEECVLQSLIRARKAGAGYAYCENLGAISLARQAGLSPIAGCGMNTLNSLSLAALSDLGVRSAVVSFESSAANLSSLRTEQALGFLAYGRLPLMRMRACPAQTKSGCGTCTGENTLTDRLGVSFPLLCSRKRYVTLLNSVPLYIGDKPPRADFALVYCSRETAREVGARVRDLRTHATPAFERTNGLYYKTLR